MSQRERLRPRFSHEGIPVFLCAPLRGHPGMSHHDISSNGNAKTDFVRGAGRFDNPQLSANAVSDSGGVRTASLRRSRQNADKLRFLFR